MHFEKLTNINWWIFTVEKNMPACKKWGLYVKGELFYDEISICLKIVKTLTSGKKKELGQWFETQWFWHLLSWHFCPVMSKLGRTELFNLIYFEDSAYTNLTKYHQIVSCIDIFKIYSLKAPIFSLMECNNLLNSNDI